MAEGTQSVHTGWAPAELSVCVSICSACCLVLYPPVCARADRAAAGRNSPTLTALRRCHPKHPSVKTGHSGLSPSTRLQLQSSSCRPKSFKQPKPSLSSPLLCPRSQRMRSSSRYVPRKLTLTEALSDFLSRPTDSRRRAQPHRLVCSASILPTFKTNVQPRPHRKSLEKIAKAGDLLGCDFSGTVSAVGAAATNVKVGDRVAGFVHGGRLQDVGSFAGG